MYRFTVKENQEKIKIFILCIFLAFGLVTVYYFHWLAHTYVISMHIYYIPIIFACIWWKEKGIFVALFLGGNLLLSHLFHELYPGEILATVLFIVVALLIVELGRITGRAEEETKAWYENYNQIFSTAGSGLVVIDKDFTIKQCNNAFLKLAKCNKAHIKGKKCFEVFPCAYCNTPDCPLRRILAGKEPIECDIEKERKDGTNIFCILNAAPFWGPGGKLMGIIEDFMDISDRKLMEKELRESEEKYRTFVKNFRGIAYQRNMNSSFVFCHGAIEKITGYTEEELISGHPRWEQIVHKDDLPMVRCNFDKLCKDRDCVCDRQYRIVRKDEQIRWVDEIIQNSCGESNKPFLIQGIIYDITERKHTEEALRRSEEKFLHAQRMESIGRLAGGIAHDFNNILTIINGNSGMLLDKLKKHSPLRREINEIHYAGERASSLIDQLLAFSRKQVLQFKILNVNSLIKETEKMLQRLIGENIKLRSILDPELMNVKADPTLIGQIIMNLAVNARDAMPHGGMLTIRTENVILDQDHCGSMNDARPGKFIRLSIQDNGIGIDKSLLKKIFEPFFTTKKPGEGTGLGLSTVYGLTKEHEGWITAYSEPGNGTIFEIYLPAVSAKEQDKDEKIISPQEYHGAGERILVVEDDEGVRRFAKSALEENGYSVCEANNASEALSLFDREGGNIYLIFSDITLPDINGAQLAAQLRAKNPELVVILCSGYTYLKSQWSILSREKYHFIKKPYNTHMLLHAIKEATNLIPGKQIISS